MYIGGSSNGRMSITKIFLTDGDSLSTYSLRQSGGSSSYPFTKIDA